MKKNQCNHGSVQAYICQCNGKDEECSYGIKSGHFYGGVQSCQHYSVDGQCHYVSARGNISQNTQCNHPSSKLKEVVICECGEVVG